VSIREISSGVTRLRHATKNGRLGLNRRGKEPPASLILMPRSSATRPCNPKSASSPMPMMSSRELSPRHSRTRPGDRISKNQKAQFFQERMTMEAPNPTRNRRSTPLLQRNLEAVPSYGNTAQKPQKGLFSD
jgi:hypothetical protein